MLRSGQICVGASLLFIMEKQLNHKQITVEYKQKECVLIKNYSTSAIFDVRWSYQTWF